MRKIVLILMVLMIICIAGTSYAVEMPDMSIGLTGLYDNSSGRIVTGERVAVTLVTMFDGVLKGNVAAVFPNSNEYITSQFVGGPDITVNLFKLIAGIPKLEITKDFKLEAGAGVMADILNINGLNLIDLKKRVFPSATIGFSF